MAACLKHGFCCFLYDVFFQTRPKKMWPKTRVFCSVEIKYCVKVA